MTSGGSRCRECLKPAKKQALRRPEQCAAQVLACLSTAEPPPPGGKGVSPFPDLSTRRRHLAGRGAGAKRPARRRRNPTLFGGKFEIGDNLLLHGEGVKVAEVGAVVEPGQPLAECGVKPFAVLFGQQEIVEALDHAHFRVALE